MPTTEERLKTMREELLRELSRVLEYWKEAAWDPKRKLILPLDACCRPNPSGLRGSSETAGVLKAFSMGALLKEEPGEDAGALRTMADRAFWDLTEHFLDREQGGVYELLFADGNTAIGDKLTRTQSDALGAFCAYYRLSGNPEALQKARNIWRLLEDHAHGACDDDSIFYNTCCNWEWTPYENGLELGTYLHLLEGYTLLAEVLPEEEVLLSLSGVVDTVLERWIRPDGGLYRYQRIRWQPDGERADRFGDDARAITALSAAAEEIETCLHAGVSLPERRRQFLLGQHHLERAKRAAVRIAEHVRREGEDPLCGGIFDRTMPDGRTVTEKPAWAQAEAVTGFLRAFEYSGDSQYLDAAERTWAFVQKAIRDPAAEWHERVTKEGAPLPAEHPEEVRRSPWPSVHMMTTCVRLIDGMIQQVNEATTV
jgi:mannobiose 2-epimerase